MSEAFSLNCLDQDASAETSSVEHEPLLFVGLDQMSVRVNPLHDAFVRNAMKSPIKTARLCLRLSAGRAAFNQALDFIGNGCDALRRVRISEKQSGSNLR